MKRILLAVGLFLAALPAFAQAPTQAPSIQTFMGPSLGNRWLPSQSTIGGINNQTGTSYTIAATDIGKLVTFNNGGAIAVTLPVATTVGFEAMKQFCVVNYGAGTATITPTTSTINGASSLALAQSTTGQGTCIVSDGTNYFAY